MCGKQKSSKGVISYLEKQEYLLNFLLFWVLEVIHERSGTLTQMMCFWIDRRVKPDVRVYSCFAVACSGLEWIGLVILAYLRHRLEKFLLWDDIILSGYIPVYFKPEAALFGITTRINLSHIK